VRARPETASKSTAKAQNVRAVADGRRLRFEQRKIHRAATPSGIAQRSSPAASSDLIDPDHFSRQPVCHARLALTGDPVWL
jgi:hypothetical protein